MKAENTKERKREEKKRKGKDLIWLIFFFLGEHFSSTLLKIHALVVDKKKDRGLPLKKASIREKIIGILRFNREIP